MKKTNWLLPIIISGLAINTFNNKLFSISKNKLRNKALENKVYNWKFGSISYKVGGTGKSILLIHDTFSGASSIEFDKILHQLTKKYTVYCIDLLGYGFSERTNITYTAYLYVQLVNDFINEIMQTDHISVITSGNSNLFPLLVSQQEKDLITKCIMINPSDIRIAAMNPSTRNNTAKYLLELPFIGTTIYNLIHCRLNFNNLFQDVKNHDSMKYYIEQFYHNAHYDTANIRYSFASYVGNYMNLDIRETLQNSNISLYIISGEERNTSYEIIHEQYTSYNPSIECAVVKNSSAFPHLENPFITYDFIQLYLQD